MGGNVFDASELRSAVPSPQAWQALADRCADRFSANVVVFALNAEADRLVLTAYRRPEGRCPEWEKGLGTTYLRGQNLPGRVWEAMEGILIPEVDAEALRTVAMPSVLGMVRTVRTLMMSPFLRGGEIRGVLGLSRERAPLFSERDYQSLKIFASTLPEVG